VNRSRAKAVAKEDINSDKGAAALAR